MPTVGVALWSARGVSGLGGGVIAERLVMKVEVDRVEPKAVYAKLKPEASGLEHFDAHCLVVEVEVWLRDEEVVQIILGFQ